LSAKAVAIATPMILAVVMMLSPFTSEHTRPREERHYRTIIEGRYF